MPHDHYQTVQEIADRLKVSEATVRHWIKDGSLRAIDIGKGWRISDADLQDFLRRHETRPRETDGRVPEAVQTIRHLNGKSIQEH
ncbi:helix-turn-helix domain-containing protein (plasmid) [Agrobacterium salinitolerans]|uniref:helix-turn-helix domain-containing protein n=1 Tax=Agrobacterium salinitolerans TaxID=1183413 RepID=UPI001C23AF84|nr:helix-turn-helix domain-containing protein [Agrobacterium salinitolerans]QXC52860.1 helix-turn-helix domain-containing protein [Agrobacterium salinitolerans]